MKCALTVIALGLSLSCGFATGGFQGSPGISAPVSVANGGTNLTASSDDNLMVGNGTTWQSKALTDCTGTGKAVTYATSTNAFGCNTISGTSYVAWDAYVDHFVGSNEELASLVVPTTLASVANGVATTTVAGTGTGFVTLQFANADTSTGYGTCEVDCDSAAGTISTCAWGSPAASTGQRLSLRQATVFNCATPPKFNITSILTF